MRHTAPITIENINAPPLPISKTRKGMATKAVIHRFKCILVVTKHLSFNWVQDKLTHHFCPFTRPSP